MSRSGPGPIVMAILLTFNGKILQRSNAPGCGLRKSPAKLIS
jgi:hypothetical protein